MKAPKIVFLRYGGKSRIAKWIVSQMPETEVYIEPFCGSCSVLLAKPPSPVEVVNDLDGELIAMYRLLRERPWEFAAQLWATPYSSTNWRETARNDLERAALYTAREQQRYVGGGTSTFAIAKAPGGSKAMSWANYYQRVLPFAARMKDVQILNECALKTIKRFADNPKALIYCDPPYRGHEKEYSYGVDYSAFVAAVRGAKAKVMVSEYPQAARFFKGWRTVKKMVTGSAGTGHGVKGKQNTETLFMNFKSDHCCS